MHYSDHKQQLRLAPVTLFGKENNVSLGILKGPTKFAFILKNSSFQRLPCLFTTLSDKLSKIERDS